MIPHAAEKLVEWRNARRHAGRLLVGLDFDGTLAPIARWPGKAALPPAAREAMERLARRPDTDLAVVSGRALEDLKERVGLPGIYYAGNHGMEIEGPGIQAVHSGAASARPRIAACAAALRRELEGVQGVFIEDKELTLSVHYRQLHDPEMAREVRRRARAVCAAEPGIRITEGKKVVEVRPDVAWDKGRATRFLLKVLEAGEPTLIPALFIGDDQTDEDAFRALRGRGDGIVVAAAPPPGTAAAAYLRSPDEVASLLAALAEPE